MNVIETELSGVKIIEPRVFRDDRGFFLETYNQARYQQAGIELTFVQDNHSRSKQGILRGLHYQVERGQGKLVWCIQGEIWDVAVDLRRGSETFGKWTAVTLSSENRRQLWVPPGFGHGFCVLSETAEVIYKCTDLYDPSDEGGVIWNDPELAIAWPVTDPLLSPKDLALPPLAKARLPK